MEHEVTRLTSEALVRIALLGYYNVNAMVQELREKLDFYEQQLSHAKQQGYAVESFKYSRELSTASSNKIVQQINLRFHVAF